MRLSFHGADRGVTGSCHMIECGGRRMLVDCGMYQGGRELDEENTEPFGFDPQEVAFLLLTHAHLDHCGRLPLLTKRGFRGEVIATAAIHRLYHAGRDPFNEIKDGAIIVAGSGMCTGGRVRHHLAQNLGLEACAIIFVGYADQEELLDWHARTRAGRTFLVHGEESPMRLMAQRLQGTKVVMPKRHEIYEL